MNKVFVYGTLKEGFGNHRVLNGAKLLGKGFIRGTMYSLGGFPVVVLGDGIEETVWGEVYDVPDEGMRDLDRLEGFPLWYDRSPALVCMDGKKGQEVLAEVYHMAESSADVKSAIDNKRLVASGVWE